MRLNKEILSIDDPAKGFAGLIRAGPLLFTAGFDGHCGLEGSSVVPELAGKAEEQCENSYGRLAHMLGRAKADLSNVVRLDHVTSSQDWLPRRQSVRGRLFGRPAPLASTGVAARLEGINMLTTSAIAVADTRDKSVLVAGPQYGMGNISSLVRGGQLDFISGIRGTTDPRTGRVVPEETPEAFGAQTRTAFEIIRAILAEVGSGGDRIVRLDCYVRDRRQIGQAAAIRAAVLGNVHCASTIVALPLGARGEVEITAIALAPPYEKRVVIPEFGLTRPCVIDAEGFLLVGECGGDKGRPGEPEAQLEFAIELLASTLHEAGSELARCIRLELYLKDIYFAESARAILRRRFMENPPVICIAGADLEDTLEVKLNAIAV